MDDQHRAPGDGDRKPVRERIGRALAHGLITSADAQIRLTNVDSAQSLTELSLLTRDLDQLEAVQAHTERIANPSASAPQVATYTSAPAASGTSGRLVPVLILVVVFALVSAGAVALVVVGSQSDKDTIGATPSGQGDPASPGGQRPGGSGQDPDEPAAPAFALSAAGVKSFVATYRQKFGTSRVTDLVMYDGYVVVQVPVEGKKRHAGWIFRDGEWSDFGGISADFPGSETIDLRRLDVAAMMRNIGKARRVLNVEDFNTTYVTINYRPQFDEVPNVNIYVSNEFSESGYLATTLQGKVERSYPFAS